MGKMGNASLDGSNLIYNCPMGTINKSNPVELLLFRVPRIGLEAQYL